MTYQFLTDYTKDFLVTLHLPFRGSCEGVSLPIRRQDGIKVNREKVSRFLSTWCTWEEYQELVKTKEFLEAIGSPMASMSEENRSWYALMAANKGIEV